MNGLSINQVRALHRLLHNKPVCVTDETWAILERAGFVNRHYTLTQEGIQRALNLTPKQIKRVMKEDN